jgi:hypothetical protein
MTPFEQVEAFIFSDSKFFHRKKYCRSIFRFFWRNSAGEFRHGKITSSNQTLKQYGFSLSFKNGQIVCTGGTQAVNRRGDIDEAKSAKD